MKTLIYVSWTLARAAILYELYLDPNKKINSSNFRNIINTYVAQFGESCMDDHEYENTDNIEIAEKILNKYYK